MGEGVIAVPGRCRLWALGRRLWALGRVHGASWVLVVICGLWASVHVRYTSFVRGGLSGGRLLKGRLLGGGLSMGWDVVCGQGGAVSYICGLTISWIQWGEEGENDDHVVVRRWVATSPSAAWHLATVGW